MVSFGFATHHSAFSPTHNGATLLATGQIAKVEIATLNMQSSSELTLPNMASAPRPKKIRPSAEARLKPARRRDEVEVERPSEVPKSGRKKGGLMKRNVQRAKSDVQKRRTDTKRGKIARQVPASRRTNRRSLKKALQ